MVSFIPMTREVAADAAAVLTRLERALADVLRVVASIAVWGEPLEVVSAWEVCLPRKVRPLGAGWIGSEESEVVTIDALGHRSASASCTKVARPCHVCTYKEYLDLALRLIYCFADISMDARRTETAGFPLSETFA